MNNRSRQFLLVTLLPLIVVGVAIGVVLDRRNEPARVRSALADFLRALEAGDTSGASGYVHYNTADANEWPFLMAYLEQQAGAAQLNKAVMDRFGQPMPATDWPLFSQVDALEMSRKSELWYTMTFDGLTISMQRMRRQWLVDLAGIGMAAIDPAVAQADRIALEALAARVRAGEFDSPAAVRRAVEPIVIRRALLPQAGPSSSTLPAAAPAGSP